MRIEFDIEKDSMWKHQALSVRGFSQFVVKCSLKKPTGLLNTL